VHEFPTFHNPVIYRFVSVQGYCSDDQGNRIFFTPEIAEVPTQQHMSKNVIRVCCFSAVICGVSLRNIAAIFRHLFSIPVTESTVKRWIDEIGGNLPSEEELLNKLIEVKNPTRCHIDGYYPSGTDNCVMVIRDDSDRILITYEADTENSREAEEFSEKLGETGIKIRSVFSGYSEGLIKAVREVFPDAEFQADHFHTVRAIWKHLKKGLSEYRRNPKAEGEKNDNREMSDIASELWKPRWSLLKKPSDLTDEERKETEAIENRDDGFTAKFRSVITQIVNISDFSNTEAQAEIKLKMLKNQIGQTETGYQAEICRFSDRHRDDAMQYLRKRGLAKYRRSSDSESGMRMLRRLEKNHDGIRSEVTRKNYIKIYQVIKYLSADVTDFLNPGSEQRKPCV